MSFFNDLSKEDNERLVLLYELRRIGLGDPREIWLEESEILRKSEKYMAMLEKYTQMSNEETLNLFK